MRLRAVRGNERAAFTLIELLVVIAIIGVLVGILAPALAAARDTGRLVACGANQRSLGQAVFAYAGDYDGIIPFGPAAIGNPSFFDFYRATGMVTSLVTRADGSPVGLGLLLDDYLSGQEEVLFCPGVEQRVIFDNQRAALERFQRNPGLPVQIQGSYWYRHGSRISLPRAGDPPLRLRLDALGENTQGAPITALAMDSNFVVADGFLDFGITTITHHGVSMVNVLSADGSSQGRRNEAGRFTSDVGQLVQFGPRFIRDAFEAADGASVSGS